MSKFQELTVSKRFYFTQLYDQRDRIESNIQSILDLSSEHDICHGIAWYKIAHTIAHNIARHYDRSLSDISGIISALSPGCQWEKNVIDAISILDNGDNAIVSTYYDNKDKALDILENGNALQILGGNKVISFYHNILRPDANEHITIDRHAIRASCDWYQVYDSNKFSKDKKYFILVDSYHAIARKYNLLGSQCQAIAWITYKRLFVDKADALYGLPDYIFIPSVQWSNDSNYLACLQELRSNNSKI